MSVIFSTADLQIVFSLSTPKYFVNAPLHTKPTAKKSLT